ncbi:CYTOSINE DEAMINASE FAMILY MEMBER [Salix koriyanagi]|uniref:tRNA(adenine(34)) deaminase n=1 Tax=Salix koriyanagi TaxID=2511006 RepID=A0A9Q1AHX6_9ROSI|nr:CYTOSINE DEAMINASE FAMILY MEMBER [Salix koriyanagi]
MGRDYCRVPDYGVDHGCSFEENEGSDNALRRRKGGIGGVKLRERRCFSGGVDAEAVISLLSEEVSEHCLNDGERNWGLSKRVEMVKRGNHSGGTRKGRRRRRNAGPSSLESDAKCEFVSAKVELRKEEFTRKEEMEDQKEKEEKKAVSKGENRRGRRVSSSLSSYYSLSSTGDVESDTEAQDEYVDCLKESPNGYRKELTSGEGRSEGQAVEEFRRHRDGKEWKGEVLEATSARRTGVEWDSRKKSEKKLTEIEETQSERESSQMQSRMARNLESDYRNVSSSHNQIGNGDVKGLAVNSEEETRKQYCQMGDQVKEQSKSRRNYQEITNKQESSGINIEKASRSQKRFSGREANLVDADLVWEGRDEYKRVGEIAAKNNVRRATHQLIETSTTENASTERASNLQRQSESRMKILVEDRALGSFYETNEKQLQMGEKTSGQVQSRRSSQQFSKIPELHDSSNKMTSILQSETIMKQQEVSKNVVSRSGTEAKEHQSHTDQNALQGTESSKGSGDVTSISLNVTNVPLVHSSSMTVVTNFGRTSGKRIFDQENELTSAEKAICETRERDDKIEQNVTQFKSTSEVCRATNKSRLHETTSQVAFDSQASANMVSQVGIQKVDVGEGNERTSQTITMPPSPQILDRGSFHVNLSGAIANQEDSRESLESGSSTLYRNSGGRTAVSQQEKYGGSKRDEIYGDTSNLISTEDALGLAHRLEASSLQFAGEFVQKARHEESTSEIQKEKTVSDTTLAHEVEKQRRKSSSQYDTKDLQLKRQDSMQSAGDSGEKGPSDEMWNVTNPSVQEPPETEAPAGSTAIKSMRTGRSMWNIISNIVRLRWGSHAETPKSTQRSGEKSLSNDSAASESWFSGHEPDENSDENLKRERKGMAKEAASSHQLRLTETSSPDEVKASDTFGLKNIIRSLEGDTSSPSIALKIGSTTKAISSPSEEENLGWSRDWKNSQVATSSMEVGESSLVLLPPSSISGPIVEESLGTAKNNISVSCSMERPDSEKLNEVSGSEGKGAELKQRKLQRNEQVGRDIFNEWEEAYLRESEQRKIDEMFMREALLDAKKAANSWEVPVGAVLVHHGKIIARGYNLVEELRDSTAHAEMICIREASNKLRSWRLSETTLYVTLEPCPMCAGAILQARINTLVWGAPNKLLGADGSWIRLFPDGQDGNGSELADKPAAPVHPFHPKMTIRRGILELECANVMQQFFQLRRRKKEKKEDSPPQPSSLSIRNPKILSKMHDIFHAMFCL